MIIYNGIYVDSGFIWQALFVICNLFRETALAVTNYYGYDYPTEDDQRVSNYLQDVRILPRDAKGAY
jgi:aminoglycoside 6-adenylyltransferase